MTFEELKDFLQYLGDRYGFWLQETLECGDCHAEIEPERLEAYFKEWHYKRVSSTAR